MFKTEAIHDLDGKTDDRVKVEQHELQEESPIEKRYRGTDADRHDMVVLGRKQVLRVLGSVYVHRSQGSDCAYSGTSSYYPPSDLLRS